jgi:GTP-binding protein Era
VGEKVSITSARPQTTRHKVVGVLTRAARPPAAVTQFIFVDTPGYQRQHASELNRRMNATVTGALRGVDVVVLVVDARRWTDADDRMLRLLPAVGGGVPATTDAGRVVLALNKVDLMRDRDQLLPQMAAAAARYPFAALVPISAERRHQLEDLLRAIEGLLPNGEPLYPPEQYTDRDVRFLAAELIREKAFRLLGDEIPYGVAVTIERWEEQDRRVAIDAALWVERAAHKSIVIGASGAKLREIGRLARAEIAIMLDQQVHLHTHVRVRTGWHDKPAELRALGYE